MARARLNGGATGGLGGATRSIALALVAAFSGLGGAACTCGDDGVLARLQSTQGSTSRDDAAHAGAWRPAQVGDVFRLGDGLRTGADARARVTLTSGGQLDVDPDTEVRFGARDDEVEVVTGLAVLESDDEGGVLRTEFGLARLLGRARVRARSGTFEVIAGEAILERGAARERVRAGEPALARAAPEPVSDAETIETDTEPIDPVPIEEPRARDDDAPSADLVIAPRESPFVHVAGALTVRFTPLPECAEHDAAVTVDAQLVTGSVVLDRGDHPYSITCGHEQVEGTVRVRPDLAAPGRVRRSIRFRVDADGRDYDVLHELGRPRVVIGWSDAPSAPAYRLVVEGPSGALRRESSTPSFELGPGALAAGRHRFHVEAGSARSPTSTLTLDLAPVLGGRALSAPRDRGFDAGAAVVVRGIAPPGWRASIEGAAIAIDRRGRFEHRLEHAPAILEVRLVAPGGEIHRVVRRAR